MVKRGFLLLVVLIAILGWLASRRSNSLPKISNSNSPFSTASVSGGPLISGQGSAQTVVLSEKSTSKNSPLELEFEAQLRPLTQAEYEPLRSATWIREDVTLEAQGYTKWEQIQQDHAVILADPTLAPARRIATALRARGVSETDTVLHTRQLYGDAGNFWKLEQSKEESRTSHAELQRNLEIGRAGPEAFESSRQALATTLQSEIMFQRSIVESARRRLRDQLGIIDEEFIAEIFRERPTEFLPSSRPKP